MDAEDLVAELQEMDDEILTADGFEDALVGYVEQFGRPAVALYDRDACIEILMRRDGMELEVAVDYFDFNVIGSGVGDHTPAFATLRRKARVKK